MKTVREPCAGNPPARFDERRGGNGPMEDLGEWVVRKHLRVVGSDLPTDTAPPADSTDHMFLLCTGLKIDDL